jgi:hypothetical protein
VKEEKVQRRNIASAIRVNELNSQKLRLCLYRP